MKTKRILSAVLAFVMIVSTMVFPVFAENVTDETALFNALAQGGLVILDSDINITSTITVPHGVTATLDLNGFKLNAGLQEGFSDKHIYAIDNYGTLTITDSSINGTGEINARGIYNGYNNKEYITTAVMNIEGGTINAIDVNGGYGVGNYATLNMSGGTITSKEDDPVDAPESGNYDATSLGNFGIATLTGGTITSTTNFTYAIATSGELIVPEDSTLSVVGGHGAVAVQSNGSAEINGGEFVCAGVGEVASSDHVIYVSGNASINITDGTFTHTNTNAASSGSAVYASGTTGTVDISGGSFVGLNGAISGNVNTVIKGGSFATAFGTDQYDNLKKYVVPGSEITLDGETYVDNSVLMDGEKYSSLQAAVDEATKTVGTYEIILAPGINDEDISIHQTEGVNITIKGNGTDTIFTGYVKIYGHCRYDKDETLTFDGVVFETSEKDHVFIEQTQQTGKPTSQEECYPHNITVQNCSFIATGDAVNTAVGVKFRYGYNNSFKDVESTNMHSLMQNYAGVGLEFDNVEITGKNGIGVGSAQNVTIKNSTMDVAGYGIRIDAQHDTTVTVESCDIDAFIPVAARKASAATEVIFTGSNTMKANNTDGIWFAINTGNDEYSENGTAPTETTNVKVTLNDTGLNNTGVAGEYVEPLDYVAKIGDTEFDTVADAIAAASVMTGDVTVEIYGKVTLNSSLSGSYDSITFAGMNKNAEIYLDVQGYITATGKKVAFKDLTLSKSIGGFVTNAGFMNVAFGVYDVNEVIYTNCIFANGAYASSGKVTFTGCTFYRSHDKYGLWAYGNVDCVVDDCVFDDYRGIKMYAEGAAKTTELTVKNTDFSAVDNKPAIVLTYGKSVTLEDNTYSSKGVFELDKDGSPNGTKVTLDKTAGITCVNDDGACGVLVDDKIYTTVAQATEVAVSGSEVTLLHDSAESVELPEGVTLNRNGYNAAGVTVKQRILAGSGTAEAPFLINNLEDLIWFRDKVDEQAKDGSTQFAGKYFKLTDDIDLAGINWNPIGSMSGDHGSFLGVFDGDNHTISNLCVEQPGNGIGLFARTAGNAVIKNLTLNNVTVKSTNDSNYVGGLVGNAYASTKIENVHVTGNIDISGRGYLGGIAGHGYVVMDNVSVKAKGTISSSFWCVGGILGYGGEGCTNITNATVDGLEANGLVLRSAAGGIGGIVGMAEDNKGTQPISGSNLTAKNIKIETYVGGYGTAYADYALGYLYGGNPTSKLTGELVVDNVDIKTSTGKEPAIQDAVAQVNGVTYFDLATAFKNATSDCEIKLLKDVTISEKWDCRYTGAKFTVPVTINGNGKTIKLTGNVDDKNWNTVFRFEDVATVKNLTIDASEAIGIQRGISSKLSITVENVTFIGNGTTAKYAIIFGEGAAEKISDLIATITECEFTNWTYGVSDNRNNQDAKAVTITDSDFTNSKVLVSASEKIVFNKNNVNGGSVDISSHSLPNELSVEAKGNTLDADFAKDNTIEAAKIDAQEDFVTPVAKINGKYFTALNEAINMAVAGETLVIMRNFVLDETVKINGDKITLDLNGKTISLGNSVSTFALRAAVNSGFDISGDVTIKNGTIDLSGVNAEKGIFFMHDGGTLELDDVKLVGSDLGDVNVFTTYYNVDETVLTFNNVKTELSNVEGKYFIQSILNSGEETVYPTVVIKDSEINITNGRGTFNTINVDIDNSKINVSDMAEHVFRRVQGTVNDTTINAESDEYFVKNHEGDTLKFTGKTIVDDYTKSKISLRNDSKLEISGFSYSFNPSAYNIASGYKVFRSNGRFFVIPKYTVSAVVNDDDKTVETGEEFTVSVKVTGGAFTNAGWSLKFDGSLVEYDGTGAENMIISKEIQGAGGTADEYADGTVVATYKFKANTDIFDTKTAVFEIVNGDDADEITYVDNYMMAGYLNIVEAEKKSDTVTINLKSETQNTIAEVVATYDGMEHRGDTYKGVDSKYVTYVDDADTTATQKELPPAYTKVGTHTFKAHVAKPGITPYTVTGKVIINPRPVTPTVEFNVDPDVNTVTYKPVIVDVVDNTFTGTVVVTIDDGDGDPTNDRVVGTFTKDDFKYDGNGNAIYTGTAQKIEDVPGGDLVVKVEYTAGDNDNYKGKEVTEVKINVDKLTAPDTLKAQLEAAVDKDHEYDDNAHGVEIGTLPTGWSVASSTGTSITNVGKTLWTVVFTDTNNKYQDYTYYVTFEVTPRKVTIAVEEELNKPMGVSDEAFGLASKYTITHNCTETNCSGKALVRSGDLGTIEVVRVKDGELYGTYDLTINYTPNRNYEVSVTPGQLTIGAPVFKIEVVDNTWKNPDATPDYTAGASDGKDAQRLILVYTNADAAYFTCEGKVMYDVTARKEYKYVEHNYAENMHTPYNDEYRHVYAMVVDADLAYEPTDAVRRHYEDKIEFAGSDEAFKPIKVTYDANINQNPYEEDQLDTNDFSMVNGIYNAQNALYDEEEYQLGILKADTDGDKLVDTEDAAWVKTQVGLD